MSLQITEKSNIFYLKGNMNEVTSTSFTLYFENLFAAFQKIIVNIDEVNTIDKNGVSAFKKMFLSAFENKKQFLVIGNGCKDIYDDFEYTHRR